ncbi:MAG TPA: UbiD family decarboxylase, partial [Chloroflexota bacterium]|nr:UbiD family decarboxylase [Chloroflexota bacterium]
FNDLRSFMHALEERDLLQHVNREVDPNLEIGTIMHEVHRQNGPAILFERVKGCDHPLASGLLGTAEHLALALDTPTELRELQASIITAVQKPVSPVVVGYAPCQENVTQGGDIDIGRIPAPIWHSADGGKYIGTLGVVITQDPDTGMRNAAVYREQVLGRNKTAVLLGRHGGITLQKYRARKQPMPVATCFGVDPALLCSAIMPLNYGEDEVAVAGGLRGEPTPLVKARTVDLLVPANCEFVFEGYISPDQEAWSEEGPFGEYTGYYAGETFRKPTVELTAVTHRDNPVMWGTMEGRGPNESELIATLTMSVGLKLDLLKMGIPGIKDLWCRGRGFVTAISLERQFYNGHARQVIDAMLTIGRATKWIIVVDADIDVFNWQDVDWALSTRVQPHRDVVITDDRRIGMVLDPSIPPANRASWSDVNTSKIGVDATTEYKGYEWPQVIEPDEAMLQKVRGEWAEYGIRLGAAERPLVGMR